MLVAIKKNLEPCPFCGKPAVVDKNESREAGYAEDYFALGCETTHCRGSVYREVSYAPSFRFDAEIKSWNQRP